MTEHDEAKHNNALIARQFLAQIFDPSFNLGHQALRVSSPTVNMRSSPEIFGSEPFEVVDVGGQPHILEDWKFIVKEKSAVFKNRCIVCYCVSLEDFRYNGAKGNQLAHSLDVWKQFLCQDVVRGVPILLIFNKKDLFLHAVANSPLGVCQILEAAVDVKEVVVLEHSISISKFCVQATINANFFCLKKSDPKAYENRVEETIRNLFTSCLGQEHIHLASLTTSASDLVQVHPSSFEMFRFSMADLANTVLTITSSSSRH